MSDKRPTEGEDAEPNPESKVPAASKRGAARAAAADDQPRQHEDDGEGYDASDDGPVEVPEAVHQALYEDACVRAELAGLTAAPAPAPAPIDGEV